MNDRNKFAALFLTAFALASVPATAQESSEGGEKRTRLILGPQLAPSWPGADQFSVVPYVDFSRTRDAEFAFEAPDESFGSPLIHSG